MLKINYQLIGTTLKQIALNCTINSMHEASLSINNFWHEFIVNCVLLIFQIICISKISNNQLCPRSEYAHSAVTEKSFNLIGGRKNVVFFLRNVRVFLNGFDKIICSLLAESNQLIVIGQEWQIFYIYFQF